MREIMSSIRLISWSRCRRENKRPQQKPRLWLYAAGLSGMAVRLTAGTGRFGSSASGILDGQIQKIPEEMGKDLKKQ